VSHFGVDPSIESEGKEEIIILEKSENNVLSLGKVVKSVSTCPPVRLPEKQRKMIRKPKKILKKKSALNKPCKTALFIHDLAQESCLDLTFLDLKSMYDC